MPAWNKIYLSKNELQNLYLNKRWSIAKIANFLGCSTQPVYRTLREYKIPRRTLIEACTKIEISKKQLKKWYLGEKLSMFEISKKLNCSRSSVVLRFQKLGIKSRGHLGLTPPINITRKGFWHLYHHRRLSLEKIAKIVHCSEGGLERKFKKYGLKPRTMKNRACKYVKKNFSGDPIEKAYLLGFRLGDLNVMKRVNVIQVRCSSTVPAQIKLIKILFSKYSTPKITLRFNKKFKIPRWDIVFLVNKSFRFLLSKEDKIPRWITKSKRTFWAFFAGYTDAEGSFYLAKSTKGNKLWSAEFAIQTQQRKIICGLWENMQKFEIYSPAPRISRKAGYIGGNGIKNNKDMWQFAVSKKASLWKLIHLLRPYIKHKNKVKKIKELEKNIILRNELPYSHPIILLKSFSF